MLVGDVAAAPAAPCARGLDDGEGGDDERDDRHELPVDEPRVHAHEAVAVAAAAVALVLEAHVEQHYDERNAPPCELERGKFVNFYSEMKDEIG